MKERYQEQVALLLKCLPFIVKADNFVLKGGTAINLFYQNFPRLSVDIDLIYLPIQDRNKSLAGIEAGLNKIADLLKHNIKNVSVHYRKNIQTKTISKLEVSLDNAQIKIEPNLILRGTVFPPVQLDLVKKAEDIFKLSVLNVPVASKADVYGGKLCAALDRQHPRDLFDVYVLLENEGITDDIKTAFLVYLVSNNRPMHELLNPNRLDQLKIYNEEFLGMAEIPVPYEKLIEALETLIICINATLTNEEKAFLVSVKKGTPNWSKIGLPHIKDLPGVKWKLMNIAKMSKSKHAQAIYELEKVLYS